MLYQTSTSTALEATSYDFKANGFSRLVKQLKDILGPSSGLTSHDVDVTELAKAMQQYRSDEIEWRMFAMENPRMGYTRNLVDEGNGKSNLLILVWSPGKGSPIHDHGNAHCLMRILRGTLTETRFDFPAGEQKKPMTVKSVKKYDQGSVAYMSDTLGVHRIMNEGSDFAVSLHLYTPPNVAKGGCNIFSEETGSKHHVKTCGNYSAYGKKIED